MKRHCTNFLSVSKQGQRLWVLAKLVREQTTVVQQSQRATTTSPTTMVTASILDFCAISLPFIELSICRIRVGHPYPGLPSKDEGICGAFMTLSLSLSCALLPKRLVFLFSLPSLSFIEANERRNGEGEERRGKGERGKGSGTETANISSNLESTLKKEVRKTVEKSL